MAALTGITAVRPGSEKTALRIVQYGATVSVGQPVYKNSANKKHSPADSDASAAAAAAEGIAMTPGVDGGYGIIAVQGPIVLVGTTMSVGLNYYVGRTAGTIAPESDLTTGDYVSRLGVASTSTQLELSISNTGIVKP